MFPSTVLVPSQAIAPEVIIVSTCLQLIVLGEGVLGDQLLCPSIIPPFRRPWEDADHTGP